MSETITTFGMELPILKSLGDGYALALHKNGPCIATEHSISTLDCCADRPQPKDTLFDDDEDEDGDFIIPENIARAALRAYVDWSWSQIQNRAAGDTP